MYSVGHYKDTRKFYCHMRVVASCKNYREIVFFFQPIMHSDWVGCFMTAWWFKVDYVE